MVFLLSTMAASCATRTSAALAACCSCRNRGWRSSRDSWAKSRSRSARRNSAENFGSRRARVKALLLDQSVLRGIGNIYADESLFRARLHPARIAENLDEEAAPGAPPAQSARFWTRPFVPAALPFQTTSIPNGNRGEFQLRHRVYQRDGKPCFRCKAKIRRRDRGGQEQPLLSALPARAAEPQRLEEELETTDAHR